MLTAPMFLDEDALRVLTGYAQKAKQVQQLRRMGVPFYVNARGAPVVVVAKLERHMAERAAHMEATQEKARALIAIHEMQEARETQRREAADRRRAERAATRAQTRPALVRFHAAKRRTAKLCRTPPWADVKAIRAVYAEAKRLSDETGVPHHVDHEIPLQGELVSGLHVHSNLKTIPGKENSRKKNRFEVT